MPRLAANLSTLFREVGFLERFAEARRAGFHGVEYQFPYEFAAADVAAAARDAGVQVVLHNAPRGEAGDMGTACLPMREKHFRDDVERAVHYAQAVGCRSLHVLAGLVAPAAALAELHSTYVANLKYAAARLGREGIRLLIEPVSERTAAGYFLKSSGQAVQVLDEVGAANACLQYDVFHMQLLEGNLAATIERLLPRIGHLQIADVPGRDEPGNGEINYPFLLERIDRLGYSGWIGCEYNPRGDTVEGLKWAKPYL